MSYKQKQKGYIETVDSHFQIDITRVLYLTREARLDFKFFVVAQCSHQDKYRYDDRNDLRS